MRVETTRWRILLAIPQRVVKILLAATQNMHPPDSYAVCHFAANLAPILHSIALWIEIKLSTVTSFGLPQSYFLYQPEHLILDNMFARLIVDTLISRVNSTVKLHIHTYSVAVSSYSTFDGRWDALCNRGFRMLKTPQGCAPTDWRPADCVSPQLENGWFAFTYASVFWMTWILFFWISSAFSSR